MYLDASTMIEDELSCTQINDSVKFLLNNSTYETKTGVKFVLNNNESSLAFLLIGW